VSVGAHDEHGYRRNPATWVAFAALFAFGLLNAMLGPVLPYLRRSEHISYIVGALHQVAFAVGGMTAGLLATRSRGPRRRTIALGLTGAALAGLLLAYGGILPATIVAALLISAFGTAALIRTWALLSDLHTAHRAVAMTEGEVAVSLAGVLTPALVSVCAGPVGRLAVLPRRGGGARDRCRCCRRQLRDPRRQQPSRTTTPRGAAASRATHADDDLRGGGTGVLVELLGGNLSP
jgi:MFS family permease